MYVGGEVITGTKCEIDRAQTTDRLKFVPALARRGTSLASDVPW